MHLLYTRKDSEINESTLEQMTPDRDQMAQVYRALRDAQREVGAGFFTASNADVAMRASKSGREVSQDSVKCAIEVFRELGLIETHSAYTSGEVVRSVHVVSDACKVELSDSVRYREGLAERAVFQDFKAAALNEPAASLEQHVQRPILPGCAV